MDFLLRLIVHVLQIRDGLLSEDAVLGKYCSTETPAPLQTTGPAAWIHFHSDSTVTDQGFHMTYTTSSSETNTCALVKFEIPTYWSDRKQPWPSKSAANN